MPGGWQLPEMLLESGAGSRLLWGKQRTKGYSGWKWGPRKNAMPGMMGGGTQCALDIGLGPLCQGVEYDTSCLEIFMYKQNPNNTCQASLKVMWSSQE